MRRYLAVALGLFVLAEVNYPLLTPQTQLALFALVGLALVFLGDDDGPGWVGAGLVAATIFSFGYVAVMSEPRLDVVWIGGQSLGNRAGDETWLDELVGLGGLLLVLEAARRTVGPTLPLLSLIFVAYAAGGAHMPDWLFPHRGYDVPRIVSQTFLHSQGVFGVALKVMFTFVYLFVLFGAVLERTGATGYVIAATRRRFGASVGGPAKVAVLSSGLMGSLSGSAVANTATTGTFTIPLMRSAGFRPAVAGGIEAAASAGGALVPPIMGAGAYMMLEIVSPPVTYLQIIRAALIPAVLYYAALLLIVHLQAQGGEAGRDRPVDETREPAVRGLVFAFALAALIVFLVLGYTPFRAVSLSLAAAVLLALTSPHTRLGPAALAQAAQRAASAAVALISAAACVGIIIGVVTLTGIGARLPGVLLPLAQDSLPLALLLLMVSTIVLGMGLPSAVCYLLMATLVGPILGQLGLVPLAAHLFIFYFGMMSMVTPPVALAAYTAAAIAGSRVMETGLAAFRFALIGFALPFAFVLQPQLLQLAPDGEAAGWWPVLRATSSVLFGTVCLAAAVTGQLRGGLTWPLRAGLLGLAGLFCFVPLGGVPWWAHGTGLVAGTAVAFRRRR